MKVIQKWKPEKNPVLVSKTETKWQNFSLSSRSLRLGGKILVLVSKHEIERKKFSCSSRSTRLKERKSRSRLEAWDRKKEILDPVSDTRLKDRYSRSRLESWNRALVGHWFQSSTKTTHATVQPCWSLWCQQRRQSNKFLCITQNRRIERYLEIFLTYNHHSRKQNERKKGPEILGERS